MVKGWTYRLNDYILPTTWSLDGQPVESMKVVINGEERLLAAHFLSNAVNYPLNQKTRPRPKDLRRYIR
jgi:hypothetical protein